ncbi:hypothetical protein EAF00_009873 [Botryotinia globosa]|nr:hypothetical protein EAF00_009873 [Botryotinia globosa]
MDIIESVNRATSAAELSPTEHLLLKHFIKEAAEPKLAAQFIQSIVDQDKNNVENNLREFKKYWRKLASRLKVVEPISKSLDALVRERDGPYCTMSMLREGNTRPVPTPVESAHVIPPSFLRDIESAAEYKLAYKYPEPLKNLFFGNGFYFSGSLEWFKISTTNPTDLPLPSKFLFDIHRRFTTALHLFSIEDQIGRGWPKPTSSILQKVFGSPITTFKRAFHNLWLWVPDLI